MDTERYKVIRTGVGYAVSDSHTTVPGVGYEWVRVFKGETARKRAWTLAAKLNRQHRASREEDAKVAGHTHRFDGTMRCMGCGKHHDDLIDRTQYRLFHNLDAHFSRAGTVEDRYLSGHEGEITVDDQAQHESVCELIFARHNRDDRPDGQSRPSLSVGDVIVLTRYEWNDDQGPMVLTYTVDTFGFQPLPQVPQDVLADYPEGYFEETRR